jgi:hypothetical protein
MIPYRRNTDRPRQLPREFQQAVRDAATSLNWRVVTWQGDSVLCVNASGKDQTVGLNNLYLRWRKTPAEEWPEMITGFLSSVNSAVHQDLSDSSLDDLAEQLLVRVGLPFTSTGRQHPWGRPLGDTGLHVNLVIDFPQTMAYVNEDRIEDSGQTADHWLARALDNLQARTSPDCFQVVHEESGLMVCETGDSYDASRSLILDRLLPGHTAGFLVAVPHRELLVVLPVRMEAIAHFHLTKMIATRHHRNAPYAISDEVFWVHEGNWQKFSVEIKEENIVLSPSAEFMEVLNRLAPDTEDEDTETGSEEE